MLNINFEPFPTLKTERTLLRMPALTDSSALSELRSIEEVNRYIKRATSFSVEDAEKLIQKLNNAAKNNESVFWALNVMPEEKLIGTACLWNISVEDERAEIGYELHTEFQGKGLMQEAVAKVIDYGFTQMKLKWIDAVVHGENVTSLKLLERFHFKQNPEAEAKIITELPGYKVYSLHHSSYP